MKLVATLLLVAAVAAAAVLNVVLLGRASTANDPIGKLRPQAHLPAAPSGTIRPPTGRVESEGRDD